MFLYKEGELVLQQGEKPISVQEIAGGEKTPFYLYDIQGIREWYEGFQKSFELGIGLSGPGPCIFFAMKANFNPEVLKVFLSQGGGLDVVSLGEAKRALSLGFSPKKLVFSGVGKSFEELELAVEKEFFQINAESLPELQRLSRVAKLKNKEVSVGLRVNPNVDFESHPYIKTGLKGHKFGFEEPELKEALEFIKSQPLLKLQGISMHIGSQIFELEALFQAIKACKKLFEDLKSTFPLLKVLDIGGGLGFNYQSEGLEEEKQRLKDFSQVLKAIFKDFKAQVITEPGRFLVAPFALLCAKVEYIKQSGNKRFVILNSGMNHFLRPALYKAKHRILPLKKQEPLSKYDVVGPICETGDTFAKDCLLPPIKEGDWLAIADTGAYGFVLSNSYNLQVPAKEISFDKGQKLPPCP